MRSLGGQGLALQGNPHHEWCWCSKASSLGPLKLSVPQCPRTLPLSGSAKEAAQLKLWVRSRQAGRGAPRMAGPVTPMVKRAVEVGRRSPRRRAPMLGVRRVVTAGLPLGVRPACTPE